MSFTLNAGLNARELAPQFSTEGDRLRFGPFLDDVSAAKLLETLSQTSFNLIASDGATNASISSEQLHALAPKERQDLQSRLMAAATKGEGFHYQGHQINADAPAGLEDIKAFLNSKPVLEFIREVTGEQVTHADAQATLYGPGHYLTRHRDQLPNENRRLAYVINMTPQWHPDWGGLLQFYEEDGTPLDAWTPGYNLLSLFHTSYIHAVTYVAPFAGAGRYGVTGWFHGA